jgi:pyroglutamyl-peptidase
MHVGTIRILITGFGPFPGVIENASGGFAERLAAEAGQQRPGWRVRAAVLPVDWTAAPERLAALMAETQPAVCLHFGVAASARGLVVETHAGNAAAPKPDASGRLPAWPVLRKDAPALLRPPASPARLVAHAAAGGLPVTASPMAGDYVCNALFFHALWLARQQAAARQVAFVHLPVRVGHLGLTASKDHTDAPVALEPALNAGLRLLEAMCALAGAEPAIRAAGADASARA